LRDYFLSLVRGERRGLWPALQRGGLCALSVPYGWAVGLRNWLYTRGWKRICRVSVPVVSVGNLTLGGTGKTPCVEYIARFYRERDVRVAILSRGYGSEDGRNDEARLLEDNLPDVPHLQGPDRASLAGTAVAELDSEVLILDDGFQHRRLHRDLDIVLIDATAPWGYDYLFPRGLLREAPVSLRRADIVVLTRCDQVDAASVERLRQRIRCVAPGVGLVETSHRPVSWINADKATRPLEDMRGRPVAALCGIGNPEGFRRTLLQLGLDVQVLRTFPDHHAYSRDDVENLRNWARQQTDDCIMVTTQKDLVKVPLTTLGGRELWALRIELDVHAGAELLDAKLQEVLGHRT
jgi:tetraacyldisaccharide 4'-kinase